MSGRAQTPRRRPLERALAWVFTGPLGHLYSVVADLLVFAVRSLVERARRRARAAASRRPTSRWGAL